MRCDNPTITQCQTMTWMQVLSDTLDIPGALMAIRLVTRITGWQGERDTLVKQKAAAGE